MATAAVAETGVSQLTILPAGNPYQRGRLPIASAIQRKAMLDIAFDGMSNVLIDVRELEREGPTFTVDTLRELRQVHGVSAALTWLIGGDAFARLDSWHHWLSLFELANFAVALRQGAPHPLETASDVLRAHLVGRQTLAAALPQSPFGKVAILAAVVPGVSSTDIRERLKNHQSIRGLAPDGVCDYIEHHRLYDSKENT